MEEGVSADICSVSSLVFERSRGAGRFIGPVRTFGLRLALRTTRGPGAEALLANFGDAFESLLRSDTAEVEAILVVAVTRDF